MKTKSCLFCGEEFSLAHGNACYCPGEICAYEAKKLRSINQYAAKSLRADAMWTNEKFLRETYYKHGSQTEIAPHELEKVGFDFDLNSEEKDVDGTLVFCMRNFGYSFLKNKNIIIWKLK